MTTRNYEYFKSKTLPELAEYRFALSSTTALPQLVYEEKLMEQKHELDLKLLQEQAKMMKSSNRTIAIFTITATLLGSIVGAVVQATLPEMMKKTPKATTQQNSQSDIKPLTSGVHPENKDDKVPASSSPRK